MCCHCLGEGHSPQLYSIHKSDGAGCLGNAEEERNMNEMSLLGRIWREVPVEFRRMGDFFSKPDGHMFKIMCLNKKESLTAKRSLQTSACLIA